jgi:general stress protein 26
MNKNEAIDIVRDAGFGFLSTIDGNRPHVRPMMPYLTEDNELLLALLPRSRTIEHIRKNPNVELCFVDRKMWYCRIAGQAEISSDPDKKAAVWGGGSDASSVLCRSDRSKFHACGHQDRND